MSTDHCAILLFIFHFDLPMQLSITINHVTSTHSTRIAIEAVIDGIFFFFLRARDV